MHYHFLVNHACSGTSEVIVVCDGTTDGSDQEAARLQTIYPNLRIVTHDHNLGYGAAVWSGMSAANLEFVFFTDADGQFDPQEMNLLVAALGTNSGVLGYRAQRNDPPGRRLLGWVYTQLSCLAFGVRARDMNCAFKLLRRSTIADLPMRSRGALFNGELLARLCQRGARFGEVGVHHYPRVHGQQSGARAGVVFGAFCEFVALWWALRWSEPSCDSVYAHEPKRPSRTPV